jgi:membrane AbrB-like protein
MPVALLLLTLAAASASGLVADRLHIPGGLILGAMLGSAGVTLLSGQAAAVPPVLRSGAFIVIGAAIGVTVTRAAVVSLGSVLAPAVLAGALVIVAGLGIAYLLRAMGMAPPGDVLATSPGALSVMSAVAVEQGTGAVEVALFHLVRVVMVLVSLPLIIRLLPGS